MKYLLLVTLIALFLCVYKASIKKDEGITNIQGLILSDERVQNEI